MYMLEQSSLRDHSVSTEQAAHSPDESGSYEQIAATVPPSIGLIKQDHSNRCRDHAAVSSALILDTFTRAIHTNGMAHVFLCISDETNQKHGL